MERLQPLLQRLKLFDAEWYLANNADVKESGVQPWWHFWHHGLAEGRQPGPRFVPALYLEANPDLHQVDLIPLVHYLQFGHREGRPLTPAERLWKLQTGSSWPESPIPTELPDWFGKLASKTHDASASCRFRVLYGLSIQSGGTPQTNQDLMSALADFDTPEIECFVLYCNRAFMVLYLFQDGIYIPLEHCQLDSDLLPFPHRSSQFDLQLKQWLAKYAIQLVHIRHLAWQSLGLIEAAFEMSLPIVCSLHDYYTICPSVKLLDNEMKFCAGRCSLSSGECAQELWLDQQIYPLKHASVYVWQRQFAGPLALCSAFVSTTDSVRDILTDVFPALSETTFRIIPHGRNFEGLYQLAICPDPDQPFRVVVPGHLAVSKGVAILCSLARMSELAHVEWHILGSIPIEWQEQMPDNVIIHSRYLREEFHRHIAQIRPNMGAVLSIWPETWCHTLTELWSVGLPVAGFNIGAVGQRIIEAEAGWTAESLCAESMKDVLLQAQCPENWQLVLDNVLRWQREGQKSTGDMASEYWQLYQELIT